ncbi:uncharacterized protein DDB_G0271670 isoform X3 [Carassius carassius]|uniref:uncharacterized protein DDB_G0271670 isoform X3 n=1 Tax=Carassius carassius TaxID=217509 RepID=UPI00286864A0|nr:uncharacterized protein DDB_G0271670 isoform X3 [Carassius carassius]
MEEDPVMQPEHDENDVGLAQILTEVVEEVRLSIDRDINGADLLYSLLSAPWLYSLLRVYECLVQHSRDAPSPYLSYSSRLSQEIMASVRGLAAPSSEAQELYILLKCPHMQALLSAHDSVAQRDYGPVLPPLPDKLPDSEEAMRIVCLVKNKQPLCVKEGKPSYWNSLRRLTVEKLALARRFGSGEQSLLGSAGGLSSSTGLLSSGQPHSLPRYQSTVSCNLCCQTAHLSGGGLNVSASNVYDSVIMDKCADGVKTIVKDQHHKCTACSTSSLAYPGSYCPPGCGPHFQTAPSSPLLQRHHTIGATCSSQPSLVFTKQHSMDELRSAVHTVASSMDQSISEAQDLRQKMVDVTERMTDSVEENAKALSLLVEVVDKLQGLIIASKSPEVTSRPQQVSRTASGPNLPGQSIAPANAPCVSSSTSSSSSSTTSSFSSSFLNCNMDVPYVAPQCNPCKSTSCKTGNRSVTPGSKTGQTSQSNGLMASTPNDDCNTIMCLSSKRRKSKMRK